MILVAVLSNSSTLPYLIWNDLFYNEWECVPNKRTYGWFSFEYLRSSPRSSWDWIGDRYHSPSVGVVRFRGWGASTVPYSLCRPWGLDSPPSTWSCTIGRPHWVYAYILVHVHELLVGLLLSRTHDPPSCVADAQVGHLADLNYAFAYLLCTLPFLE